MSALRERIADMTRCVDWRRKERVRELARQEDDARLLGKRLRDLKADVSNAIARMDEPLCAEEWGDIIDSIDGATKYADAIEHACRVKSSDIASGADE